MAAIEVLIEMIVDWHHGTPVREHRELKCVNGHTNIDCNDIGVPECEVTQCMGASAHACVHSTRTVKAAETALDRLDIESFES